MIPNQTAYQKSSFGPAFLFLDKKRRQALAVYYAFCRLMDDIADEPDITDKLQQLDFWKREMDQTFAGKPETELGAELKNICDEFSISSDRFLLLIEGMQADVQNRVYETWDDLHWYLWRVAGIVGQATLDILGIKGPKATELAESLGFAVQLTNIVRDVWDDAQLGRVYIPTQLLQEHGLTRQAILQQKAQPALAAVLRAMAQQAKQYYHQAEQIMATLPANKMYPCCVMGFVYQKNLAKIEKMDFQFSKAVKLTKFEKLTACLYAWCKIPINR